LIGKIIVSDLWFVGDKITNGFTDGKKKHQKNDLPASASRYKKNYM